MIEPRRLLVSDRVNRAGERKPLAPCARLDIYSEYRIDLTWRVFGRLENVTNARYQEALNFGTTGRAVYAGLNANMVDNHTSTGTFPAALVAALSFLAAVLFVASLGFGPVRLSAFEVITGLFGTGVEENRIIVAEIRLPRAILALAIGSTLGLSGAALQGLLRNPLAAPSLFGAPQAAAFGAVLTISLGVADSLSFGLPLAAITGAFASVFLLLVIAGRNASLLLLILAGLAISSLAGAATALAMNLAPNPFAALEIAFWLLGSLEDRSFRHVALGIPFMAIGALLLSKGRHGFRVLTVGEEAARSLGVDVGRLRLLVVLGVALGVGASVAVAGAIGFVGLVSPHLVRPFVAHDPGRLLLPSALCGGCLLLAADIAVRVIPSTTDIKVGVFTAIIGVPFFLYLIVRERRSLAAGFA